MYPSALAVVLATAFTLGCGAIHARRGQADDVAGFHVPSLVGVAKAPGVVAAHAGWPIGPCLASETASHILRLPRAGRPSSLAHAGLPARFEGELDADLFQGTSNGQDRLVPGPDRGTRVFQPVEGGD